MCLQPPGLRAHRAVSRPSGSPVISDLAVSCSTALLSCLALSSGKKETLLGFAYLASSQKHHLRIKGAPKAFLGLQIPRDSHDGTLKKC